MAALAINLVIVVAQVVVAATAGSLSLIADAAHNGADVGALALAAVGALVARRQSARHTFGLERATVVAALANGAGLVVVSAWVAIEAVGRLGGSAPIDGATVIVTALVAAAGNLLAASLVRHGDDLNHRAATLHLMTDVATSLAVAVAGVVLVLAPTQTWVDPVASLGIAALAAWGGVRVARAAIDVLVDAVPAGLDAAEVGDALGAVEGVEAVHHLHLWARTDRRRALSAHVLVRDDVSLAEAQAVGDAVRRLARERYGVEEATLQLEARPCATQDCR